MKFNNICLTLAYLLQLVTEVVWTEVPTFGMDDKRVCFAKSVHHIFVEDNKSSLIIGKKTPPNSAAAAKNCTIQFSPLSEKGLSYLRLKFDNFYINDCDIKLTITQSANSIFDNDVQQLVKLTCEDPSPDVLYASRDYSVRMTLSRDDIYLRNYNFRVNVSLSDGPPETGPSVAVIIGIAAALLTIICIIAFIMVKYMIMKTAMLRERRAEQAIESAVQELHNGIAYTSLPCRGETNGALHTGQHDTSHDSHESSSDHQHEGHSVSKKSHVPHLAPGSEQSSSMQSVENSHVMFEPLNIRSHAQRHANHSERTNDNADDVGSSSEGSDLPPSYEEALEMPKPAENVESPNYVNLNML